MKILLLLIFLLFSSFYLLSQSLTKDRINKLKHSVVKISIEGSTSTGTGFFISSNGDVLTCWHVIEDALIKDSIGNLVNVKKIYMDIYDGQRKELQIPSVFFNGLNMNAVSNDFCLLSPPLNSFNIKVSFLKIGNFDNIQEGDEVYTSGYPLGLPYQFISRGTLSTKYIDSTLIYQRKGFPDIKIKKSVALLDLTINKGNSGGPIVRLGKHTEDDEVIGIADFLINPFGKNAERLNEEMNMDKMNYKLPSGVSLTDAMKLFSNAIIYSSNGISGCVSINHFLQVLK